MSAAQLFIPFLSATATDRLIVNRASEIKDPEADGRSLARALQHTLHPLVLAALTAELAREAPRR